MIAGIGVGVVAMARLEAARRRTPGLAARLFAHSERARPAGSLAGCFAAREALAKALGTPPGLHWHDAGVMHDDAGRPLLAVRGTVAAPATRPGVRGWHLSTTHDAGMSTAMVVAGA